MMRTVIPLISGALFGTGLLLSDMIDPARVMAFLQVASGQWDPTLAFVMGGAMLPMFVAWSLRHKRQAPLMGGAFPAQPGAHVDGKLIGHGYWSFSSHHFIRLNAIAVGGGATNAVSDPSPSYPFA